MQTTSFRTKAARLLGRIDDATSTWWRKRRLARGSRNLTIVPYHGWGNTDNVHLGARVLSDAPPAPGAASDAWWKNGMAVVRHFVTSEVPDVPVEAMVDPANPSQPLTATSNHEGYVWLTGLNDSPDRGWIDVRWSVNQVNASGRALVPPASARFGVISDLDDTVLRTGITNRLTMISTTFFNNAHTRLPFPGVAEFYQGLHDSGNNPIFYVSTSPWNLYSVLQNFLEVREIPAGPMFLTDWGIDRQTFVQPDTHAHKVGAIEQLLEGYPDLPFLLIGDAGQHDPEIYRDVVRAHPGRIRAVYIRTLNQPGRKAVLEQIGEEIRELGAAFVHAPETLPAAQHAVDSGLIDAAALEHVSAAVSD